MNANIKFISNQQDEGIDINQDHYNEDSSDRTIDLVEVSEMIYPERKKKGGENDEEGCESCSRCRKAPALMYGRCVFINECNAIINQRYDNDPSDEEERKFDEAALNMKLLQYPVQDRPL